MAHSAGFRQENRTSNERHIELTTVTWNGTTYYYAINGQGDVIGIFDVNGDCVVTYNWDNAWGYNPEPDGPMADTLGTLNPLRYRSYVYDEETGYYYLQSRYYDPEICRFINADTFTSTGQGLLGNNMFAYCLNNPVTCVDTSGTFAFLAVTAIIATGGIVGGLLGAFSAAATDGNIAESAIEGFVTGIIGSTCGLLITNPCIAVMVAGGMSMAADATIQATTQYMDTGDVSKIDIDKRRMLKTGIQTAMGTAVPQFGLGANNPIDAFATACIWAEASTLIACADVAVSNMTAAKTSVKSSVQTASRRYAGLSTCTRINFECVCLY